jgi:hypothetical protein
MQPWKAQTYESASVQQEARAGAAVDPDFQRIPGTATCQCKGDIEHTVTDVIGSGAQRGTVCSPFNMDRADP